MRRPGTSWPSWGSPSAPWWRWWPGSAACGEAPLRAIATDALANKLLALGRSRGDVSAVTSLAAPLARAAGLPAPRYVEAGGQVFTRRASCCLAWRVPHEAVCTSCPRRDPAQRQVLLEDTAARMP